MFRERVPGRPIEIVLVGRVLLQVREHAPRGLDVVRFLQHLLQHIAGKLLVVRDGSPIQRAQVVKAFLLPCAPT